MDWLASGVGCSRLKRSCLKSFDKMGIEPVMPGPPLFVCNFDRRVSPVWSLFLVQFDGFFKHVV